MTVISFMIQAPRANNMKIFTVLTYMFAKASDFHPSLARLEAYPRGIPVNLWHPSLIFVDSVEAFHSAAP
jgi:hypothetical protein